MRAAAQVVLSVLKVLCYVNSCTFIVVVGTVT